MMNFMILLIVSITLPLAFSCHVLWKCGLVIKLVGTHRGIVSQVGTLEALDMSHLLFLLDLAHALLFFLQGAISYMMTLLAPKASDKSLLWLKLHLGGLGGFSILPRCGTTALGCGTAVPYILDRLHFSKLLFDFAIVGFVIFSMGFDACFG
jgi:hypothetical protein